MRLKDNLFVKMFWETDNVGYDDIIDLNAWNIDELDNNDRETLKLLIKCQQDAEDRFKVIYDNAITKNFKKSFENISANNIEMKQNREVKINEEKERE